MTIINVNDVMWCLYITFKHFKINMKYINIYKDLKLMYNG